MAHLPDHLLTGYRNFGANTKFNIALSDAVSVDLRGWYSDGKTGIDGFPPPNFTFGDTPEFARTKELIGYAGLNAALFDGRLRNRIAFALTDTRRRNILRSAPIRAANWCGSAHTGSARCSTPPTAKPRGPTAN